jgi:hypothetical protein
MATALADIQTGTTNLPPRILEYGVQGIGKTTFGANAPKPIMIQTEDGEGVIDIARFPLATSYTQVLEALAALANEQHEYKTLIVDSLDWLEPLIWAHVCAENGESNIEDFGYGKGYVLALDEWANFIDALNYLRRTKDMTVILTAHAEVKKYNDPANEPYDRYQIALNKSAGAKMLEWADVVLFANYRIATKESDAGFNNKKNRAIGNGDRIVYTEERPAFHAKNRFNMPPELPFNWQAVSAAIPYFGAAQPAAENAAA